VYALYFNVSNALEATLMLAVTNTN